MIFISTTILILIAIFLIIKHRGQGFLGLELSKKWILRIVYAELLLAILAIVDYQFNIDPESANDILWYNMVSYTRGVLPLIGLNEFIDLKANKIYVTGFYMFIVAVIVDYIILKIISILKRTVKMFRSS